MDKPKSVDGKKAIGKLKVMEKLNYGDDYTDLFYLALLVALVGGLFSGGVGFILLPLFFFYLAAAQLYSNIGFSLWQWKWGWNWNWRMIAKYKKARQPNLFYWNVALSCLIGIVLSMMELGIFLSTR